MFILLLYSCTFLFLSFPPFFSFINLFLLLPSTLFFRRIIYWLVPFCLPSPSITHSLLHSFLASLLPSFLLGHFLFCSSLIHQFTSLSTLCLIFPSSPLPRPLSLIKLYVIHLGLSLALAQLCPTLIRNRIGIYIHSGDQTWKYFQNISEYSPMLIIPTKPFHGCL